MPINLNDPSQRSAAPEIQGFLDPRATFTPALDRYLLTRPDDTQHLAALKDVVLEIAEWLQGESQPKLWPLKVFTSQFQGADGRKIWGAELLTDLAVSLYKSTRPDSPLSDAEIVNSASHGPSAALFKTLREAAIPVTADAELRSTPGYIEIAQKIKRNFALKNEDARKELEGILRGILADQFQSDVLDFDYTTLHESSYGPTEAEACSGKLLLEEYSIARWKEAHPDEEPVRRRILGTDGFSAEDSLQHLRRAALTELAGCNDHIAVSIPFAAAELHAPESRKIEALLVDILRRLPENLRTSPDLAISSVICFGTDNKPLPLFRITARYQIARYREENPDDECRDLEITTKSGYRLTEALLTLCQKHQLVDSAFPESFLDFTPDDLKNFASLKNIDDLLGCLGSDPVVIIEALSLFKASVFEGRSISDFVERYVGLGVPELYGSRAPTAAHLLGLSINNSFIEALFLLASRGEELSLDETTFRRTQALLKRTIRREFQVNGEGLIAKLRHDADSFIKRENYGFSAEQGAFLRRLYVGTAADFEADLNFDIPLARTPAFNYEREGARFLATHPRAMLADDAGLGKTYQAAAAALALGIPRTLWLTPAPNRDNIRNEILGHFKLDPEDVIVVDSSSKKKREELINSLNGERFIITNYETLSALRRSDRELFATLTTGLGLLIADEGDVTDNPKTQIARAVKEVEAERVWYLTATPYQNTVERLPEILSRLDPQLFGDSRLTRQKYMQTAAGLTQLHLDTMDIILRRTKDETLEKFTDPAVESFESQLSGGRPRIPRFERLDPALYTYLLSPAQERLIAWMTADFVGWAHEYNLSRAPHEERIDLTTINPLSKFSWIHKAIYQPELLGLPQAEGMIDAADRFVDQCISRGEKGIIWAWNTLLIDDLNERYRDLGSRKIDGTNTVQGRREAIAAIQEGDACQVAICNHRSGGKGLTLTGATSALVLQPPFAFPALYQLEGRHHRVIGKSNIRYAREAVYTGYATPKFSDGFLESLPDRVLAEILSRGTLVEQTLRRLEGGRILYKLVLEGYSDEKDLQRFMFRHLLDGLGLTRTERYDFTGGLTPSTKALLDVSKAYLPLWEQTRGDAELSTLLAAVINQGKFHSDEAIALAEILNSPQIDITPALLETVVEIFSIKSHPVRRNFLAALPEVVAKNAELFSQSEGQESSPRDRGLIDLIPQFAAALSKGPVAPCLARVSSYLSTQRDTPEVRRQTEELLLAVHYLSPNPNAQQFMDAHAQILTEGEPGEIIHTLYRLGCLAALSTETLDELSPARCDSFAVLSHMIERGSGNALERFSAAPAGSVSHLMNTDTLWSQLAVDQIVALCAAQVQTDHQKHTALTREVIHSILAGTFLAKRCSDDWSAGVALEYRAAEHSFWSEFSKNLSIRNEVVTINSTDYAQILLDEFHALRREIGMTGPRFEGPNVTEYFNQSHNLASAERAALLTVLEGKHQELGEILGRLYQEDLELASDTKRKLRTLGFDSSLERPHLREAVRLERSDLSAVIGWVVLDQEFEKLKLGGAFEDVARVKEVLSRKERFYLLERTEGVAADFAALGRLARRFATAQSQPTTLTVTIEESDHPAQILRMGALSPSLVNCFNPNGNAEFNFWSVGAAASRNFKLLVVRDQAGREIACAAMKVRADADGKPVLFLERGMSELPYSFREQMIELVQLKAQLLSESGTQTRASSQIFGAPNRNDLLLYGTGARSGDEYAEAVFHLRNARSVQHSAVLHEEQRTSPSRNSADVVGIGTSNKPLQRYISELRDMGVTTVVDVRANPASQYSPQFNREALRAELEQRGVRYVWMGDTLGNPKDGEGRRSLEGFREYQRTERYREGLAHLVDLVDGNSGTVALTCAEGNEDDCHRKFILNDLRLTLGGDGIG